MSLKRKKSNRIVEGDVEAARYVARQTIRTVGKDGKEKITTVKSHLYEPESPVPETSRGRNMGEVNASTHNDYHPNDFEIPDPVDAEPTVVPKTTKRQSDYIQQFVARVDGFLSAMLSREAFGKADVKCTRCDSGAWAVWRCQDCLFGRPVCRKCMRGTHLVNPLHRIQRWTGRYYRTAHLWEAGAFILLPHIAEGVCNILSSQEELLERYQAISDQAEQSELDTVFSGGHGHSWDPRVLGNNSQSNQSESNRYDDDVENDMSAEERRRTEANYDRFLDQLHENPDTEVLEPDDEDDVDESDNVNQTDPVVAYLPTPNDADRPGATQPGNFNQTTPRFDVLNNAYVRVVHTNGIHHIALVYCLCQGHDQLPLDLMASRLFPSSFDKVHTLFSTQMLDIFRLSNLELKASAYQFYRLLRRYTQPMAPSSVVNLYTEFRRMSRLWRWMKKLKWAGFAGHNSKHQEKGDLALAALAVFGCL